MEADTSKPQALIKIQRVTAKPNKKGKNKRHMNCLNLKTFSTFKVLDVFVSLLNCLFLSVRVYRHNLHVEKYSVLRILSTKAHYEIHSRQQIVLKN